VDVNHRMELQYDGTGLHGWARQEGLPTVEGCLGDAFLTVIGRIPAMRVAGRTDSGVHARHQVASVHLPVEIDRLRLLRSLNALTPPGIAVTSLVPAPSGFDARKDALSRTYRYFVATSEVVSPFWAPYCWRARARVDWEALRATAAAAVGVHDFTAFTPTESEHVLFTRAVLRCVWKRLTTCSLECLPTAGREMIYLEIEADAFLRHMVRTLAGTMMEVACGVRSLDSFVSLLGGARRENAGPTAPSSGLFLWDICYAATTR
jgi:tRNA pseudouridine38-40 synthase